MLFECEPQRRQGEEFCLQACPAREAGVFEYVRVEHEADRPAPDPSVIDVAVLDMNHGWPNIGHDAIVMGIQTMACDVREPLRAAGLRLRVVSYDVRRGRVIPAAPDADGGLYVGTGGPGHLDPRRNDGRSEGSQTIAEDPAWEAPFFAWLDVVRAHPQAALLGVCHTFGVLCRWLHIADAVLRDADKGGKSAGIVDNLLTPAAADHPWFHRLIEESPDGPRIRVLDNRLYDLVPAGDFGRDVGRDFGRDAGRDAAADPLAARVTGNVAAGVTGGVSALSYETRARGGPAGDSLTMIEVARDPGGVMPRILGVNHHPEIVNRERVLMVLWQKRARGEVSHDWYEERARAMTQTLRDEDTDRRLDITSRYTFVEPLRFHVYRQLRLRGARAGRPIALHEDRVLEAGVTRAS